MEKTFEINLNEHNYLEIILKEDQLTIMVTSIETSFEKFIEKFTTENLPPRTAKFFYDTDYLFSEISLGKINYYFDQISKKIKVQGALKLREREVRQECDLPLQIIALTDIEKVSLLRKQLISKNKKLQEYENSVSQKSKKEQNGMVMSKKRSDSSMGNNFRGRRFQKG